MKKTLLIIIALLCGAGVWAQAPKDTLIFSHKLHMEGGAECTTCHAKADSSLAPIDNLLPDMDTCYGCHDKEAECTMCHTKPDEAGEYPRYTSYIAHFPHAKHVGEKAPCATCHTGIAVKTRVGGQHLPGMSKCSTCHSDLDKPGYCYDCHATSEKLKPANHALDWRKGHGAVKMSAKDNCQLCHSDNQCLQCHQGDNLDHKVHPLNFRFSHGMKARGDKENCYTCHQDQNYCQDCHRQEMVMPRNHASAGWSNAKTGGAHRRAAEMDLDNCLACHNDRNGDPICAECHKAQ
jgi:hypothetical protein